MSGKGTKTILRLAEKLEQSQQENIELVKQNKRYREAIEQALNLIYPHKNYTQLIYDFEEVLTKALESEE